MKYKAVIFDMDGVMVDSELHWPIVEKEIWPKFGVEFTPEFHADCVGKKLGDVIRMAKLKYNNNINEENLVKTINEASVKVYNEMSNLLPGVQEIIIKLNKLDIPLSIASSSSVSWINMVVKRFNLEKYFKIIKSTATDNLPGKPSPVIYEKIIADLNSKPAECVIIEDSSVGLKSAKASGAKVIAVPDSRWSFGDFSKADLIADSLEDKKVYEFLGL